MEAELSFYDAFWGEGQKSEYLSFLSKKKIENAEIIGVLMRPAVQS